MSEHAVLIHIPAPSDGSQLFLDEIEDPLIEAIEDAGVGEFDGNDIGPNEAVLYMYGPDADSLFATVGSVLRSKPLPSESYAIKRYGEPGAAEERVDLG